MTDAKSLGQRFSHVYLRRDDLLQDSRRARRRIAAWISNSQDTSGLASFLVGELGIDLSYSYGTLQWSKTIESFAVSDFLDTITLIYRYFNQRRSGGMRDPRSNDKFLQECRRIFTEESLSYVIDDAGGVHFKVDAEFSTHTNAAISVLTAARYANARGEFEKGMTAISNTSPDGKEGIRGVFGAAECLYRLTFPKSAKLTSTDVLKNLQMVGQSMYASDPVAQRAANKMISSFANWVDACHNYRHEHGVEEPSQPPLDLAIEMISAGAGFVRWLVLFDKHVAT